MAAGIVGRIAVGGARVAFFAVGGINDTIAAQGNGAVGATTTSPRRAIVAGFAFGNVHIGIAAGLIGLAITGTAVAGDEVAVVASFAGVANAVAAAARLAIGATGGVGGVGVGGTGVAGFAVGGVDDRIAAAWDGAVGATGVAVGRVAIVAGFAFGNVHIAITAGFVRLAITGTAVAGDEVAVVAGFAGVANAVAAAAGLAVGAAGGVGSVGVGGAKVASLGDGDD